MKSMLAFLFLLAITSAAQDVPLELFTGSDFADSNGNQKIGWLVEQQCAPYMRSCGFPNNKLFAGKKQISSVPRAIWGTALRSPWD